MKARRNPYRAERTDALPFRQPGFDWPAFLEQLQRCAFRGAIVGRHGNGKTTLVDELIPRLRELGESVRLLRLNQEHRRQTRRIVQRWIGACSPQEILVLDGAEQLNPLAWRAFVRETADQRGLIVTTHRPGRLPVLLECRTCPKLLEQLVRELAGDLSPEPAELHLLFRRHRGNIRDCLRELYDREQR